MFVGVQELSRLHMGSREVLQELRAGGLFRSILPRSDLSKNFTHTLGTGFLSTGLPLSAKPYVLGKVKQSAGCTLNP